MFFFKFWGAVCLDPGDSPASGVCFPGKSRTTWKCFHIAGSHETEEFPVKLMRGCWERSCRILIARNCCLELARAALFGLNFSGKRMEDQSFCRCRRRYWVHEDLRASRNMYQNDFTWLFDRSPYRSHDLLDLKFTLAFRMTPIILWTSHELHSFFHLN